MNLIEYSCNSANLQIVFQLLVWVNQYDEVDDRSFRNVHHEIIVCSPQCELFGLFVSHNNTHQHSNLNLYLSQL